NVISARDIEVLLQGGGDVGSLPPDAILTPSARDILRDMELNPSKFGNGASAPKPGAAAPPAAAPATVTSKSPQRELEAFFNSPPIHAYKLQICDLGRRLWEREYVDGNGGNISIRVGEDVVLCTPTLISKGFMKPEDMCLVDMEGNQLLGDKKRTSEVLMHLQMMKRQPRAKAVVHCHPPHATAFAVAEILPPTCMIPEFEVFCAVAIAPYRTPGTPEMGKLVADLVDKYNTILMANHGVVTWSHNTAEEAYWRMEIVEAYCRTITVTAQLGKAPVGFSPEHLKDLLKIKQSLGFVDPRFGLKECELCDNSEWRPGVACVVPPKEAAPAGRDAEAEKLVQAITEQILSKVK
ncbi:MAG: class II aldolase/adducin family protein, partial [Verrucomicrobia bacterium]|nr:class II aldolase/adducin family protein [Verrucomicrobiota bacterium]